MPAPHVLATERAERLLLDEVRTADGLKLTALGAVLGVREHTVGGWLGGTRSAPPGLFLALGDALSPAGRVRLLHALAARWGLSLTVEGVAPAAAVDLRGAHLAAGLGLGQLGLTLHTALADGRVDRDEAAAIRAGTAAVVAPLTALERAVSAPAHGLRRAA